MGHDRRRPGKPPPAHHLHFNNELAKRLDNLQIANAAAAEENASVENCWDTIQSKALAVLGRASRHLQPALREGPPAKSLHRPPHRRRQQSGILALPPPCATTSARDAERTGGPHVYGDPRTQKLQRWVEQFRGVLNRPSIISDTAIARLPQAKTNTNLDLPPSIHETIRTVQQFSSEKAPASDARSAEVYKHVGHQFMQHLTAAPDIVGRLPSLPQGINHRLMSLRFPLRGGEITILVNIFAPTMSSPAETRNKFYAELHALLASEPTTW
nr:unnamed protein product [Spirometra erinaceieuropaei]